MAENTMFADLLAAQKEMPNLQKTGINPHFKNRYVPLEELVQAVLPILNAHNFVLTQMPVLSEGQPCLLYELRHASGEAISGIMPLLCAKDDPQGQGSAITYARRYSLMALLGLTADVDDDAERAVQRPMAAPPRAVAPTPTIGPRKPLAPTAAPRAAGPALPVPECPMHGQMVLRKAGTTRDGRPYDPFYSCSERSCTEGRNGKGYTVDAMKWAAQYEAEHNTEEPMTEDEAFEGMPNE